MLAVVHALKARRQLRSPILTFATKKLSTGANGQKEDAASFYCPGSFDRAVTVAQTRESDPGSDSALGKRCARNTYAPRC